MAFTILFKTVFFLRIARDRLVDWLEDSQGQSYQSVYSLLIDIDR